MDNVKIIAATDLEGIEIKTAIIQCRILSKEDNFDLLDAVKTASEEYIKTPEGRRVYEGNGEFFNWGDFELNVPDEICRKYGFEKLEQPVEIIDVTLGEKIAGMV